MAFVTPALISTTRTLTYSARSRSAFLTSPNPPFLPHTPSPSPSHLHSRPLSTRTTTTTTMVREGEKAPNFSAEDLDGNAVSLSDFSGSALVLYFSNFSGVGCNRQSCSFRDAEAQFGTLGAKIIAVSAQGRGASRAFAEANSLSFPIISDKDGTLQKLFEVPATLGLLPGRITYVIDKDSVVRLVYNSQLSVGSHVSAAKDTLKSLSS